MAVWKYPRISGIIFYAFVIAVTSTTVYAASSQSEIRGDVLSKSGYAVSGKKVSLPETSPAINSVRYDVIDENIGDVPGVIFDKINSRQMDQNWNVDMNAQKASGFQWEVSDSAKISAGVTRAPHPVEAEAAAIRAAADDRAAGVEPMSFMDGFGETLQQNWAIDLSGLYNRTFNADPEWGSKLTEERFKEAEGLGVPLDRIKELFDTVNEEHFYKKIVSLKADHAYQKKLSLMGWQGDLIRVITAILSPVGVATICAVIILWFAGLGRWLKSQIMTSSLACASGFFSVLRMMHHVSSAASLQVFRPDMTGSVSFSTILKRLQARYKASKIDSIIGREASINLSYAFVASEIGTLCGDDGMKARGEALAEDLRKKIASEYSDVLDKDKFNVYFEEKREHSLSAALQMISGLEAEMASKLAAKLITRAEKENIPSFV